MKSKFAIIVAGGEGRRAGGGLPKQFRMLDGIPMLWWSVRSFHLEDPETRVILVLHPAFMDLWKEIYASLPDADRRIPLVVVPGGKSRLESVSHGLQEVTDEPDALVAVHDAARPLVTVEMIRRGWEAGAMYGAAVPVDTMTDSIRLTEGDRSHAVDRSRYVKVQTPQVFDASLLKKAYSGDLADTMTDDASVVEASGHEVALFRGEPTNMKVTNPLDMEIASLLLDKLR